jgi:hypothetical protein
MASPNLSEIVTTTLRNRTGKLADNVTKQTALLDRLRRRGNVMYADGGSVILQEMQYAENSTYFRYSGYETVNISPSDVLTAAEYGWKQASVAVTISGLEQIQNSGKNQIINLLTSRIKNAEITMSNNIASDCYSDGTADGGKQIGGMQLLVSTDPANTTVGGINANTWSFWRNSVFSATTDGGAPASQANIMQYMSQLWQRLVRNNEYPDLIVADNNYWNAYQNSLMAIQRIQQINGSGDAPANRMYFVNTKYLFFRPSRERNFTVEDSDRIPINQDAIVKMILFAGNMTCSNRSLQGVLTA